MTSRYLTPNGGLVREITLLHGNLGWWNIMIWPDVYLCWAFLFLANLWHRRPCYIFFGAVFCAEFFTDGKLLGHWKCLSTSLATSPSKRLKLDFFRGGDEVAYDISSHVFRQVGSWGDLFWCIWGYICIHICICFGIAYIFKNIKHKDMFTHAHT